MTIPPRSPRSAVCFRWRMTSCWWVTNLSMIRSSMALVAGGPCAPGLDFFDAPRVGARLPVQLRRAQAAERPPGLQRDRLRVGHQMGKALVHVRLRRADHY